MTTIGQQLQEARKRRGLSLKDASESTKIKIDFLSHFENDRFDFNLPEVYMYGFLKLYANYLKLDTKAIMADYSALKQVSIMDNRKRESREVFGKMHLQKKPQFLADPNNDFKVLEEDSAVLTEDEISSYPPPLKKNYKKPLFLGFALAVFGIVAIISIVIWLKEPRGEGLSKAVVVKEGVPSDLIEEDTITLIAENQVHVVVRQESNKQRLFSGTVGPNQPQAIVRQGPVKVHFSDGTSLLIKKSGGQKIKPGRSGVGWIEV